MTACYLQVKIKTACGIYQPGAGKIKLEGTGAASPAVPPEVLTRSSSSLHSQGLTRTGRPLTPVCCGTRVTQRPRQGFSLGVGGGSEGLHSSRCTHCHSCSGYSVQPCSTFTAGQGWAVGRAVGPELGPAQARAQHQWRGLPIHPAATHRASQT